MHVHAVNYKMFW